MTQPQSSPETATPAEGESFESSLAALEKVVHALEDGQQGLSQSLEQYERGIQQLKRCYALLDAAEQKIELLAGLNERGEAVTEAFESTDTGLESKRTTRRRRGPS